MNAYVISNTRVPSRRLIRLHKQRVCAAALRASCPRGGAGYSHCRTQRGYRHFRLISRIINDMAPLYDMVDGWKIRAPTAGRRCTFNRPALPRQGVATAWYTSARDTRTWLTNACTNACTNAFTRRKFSVSRQADVLLANRHVMLRACRAATS